MYERILVCLDGSLESEAVLPEVETLMVAHPGTVILFQVGTQPDPEPIAHEIEPFAERPADLTDEEYDLLMQGREQQIRQYLEAIAERLRLTGATVLTEVSFNNPIEEIIVVSRIHKVELIAMATHGRSGLSRLLHGSITENVIHHAACPILAVKIPDHPRTRYAGETNTANPPTVTERPPLNKFSDRGGYSWPGFYAHRGEAF